ncbi:glycoside hydrolase family 32 protein [Dielma fastidiosa]|uniref:Sucrose-6-phosphate hydrolase n=1 Tax=Dielma fastidiosa TaxID=1034346 RepID=A0A318LFP5_9FIRM|nr:sucrose-6-phosphate hydrolase [Dielma fastidiosa]PXX80437.1 beta-fructofuranosidase [Dielma fastidiosa]
MKLNNQWRNHFHIEMAKGLVNDPNGLCCINGEYKIFYQWNPAGCEHKNKHWGLVKTRDFVHYTKPRLVLKPDQPIDKDGCYSGTAVMLDQQLHLFYTGNVKHEDVRIPHQCMAVLDEKDELQFKKALIVGMPNGYTAHFRDPFYFKMKDLHCLLLGIQNADLKGRAVVYTSKDLKQWEFYGEVKTELEDFGYMWECPNLVSFNDADAFIFSPQGLKQEGLRYQNRYQSGYILGHYDFMKNEFIHGDFYELDHGFDFYAPQVFTNENRTMMIAWMGMPDEETSYPTAEDGYLYTLTLPREITKSGNRLLQRPARELNQLRHQILLSKAESQIKEFNFPLSQIGIEIKLELSLQAKCECCFDFNGEELKLIFDPEKELLTLKKADFHYGKDACRFMHIQGKQLQLQMYLDTSVLEIFINDGEAVMSSLFYPLHELKAFKISSDQPFDMPACEIWQLKGIIYE